MATTTFRYRFYTANANSTMDTPVTWLLDGSKHDVPNATTLLQGPNQWGQSRLILK